MNTGTIGNRAEQRLVLARKSLACSIGSVDRKGDEKLSKCCFEVGKAEILTFLLRHCHRQL